MISISSEKVLEHVEKINKKEGKLKKVLIIVDDKYCNILHLAEAIANKNKYEENKDEDKNTNLED